MKKLTLVFSMFYCAFSAYTQDCTIYFPHEEGSVIEVTNYNHKGKVESVGITTVKKVERNGGGVQIDAELKTIVKKDENIIEYSAACEDGVFKLNMFGGFATNDMGGNMEVDGDFLDIPSNPKAGQLLDDKMIIFRMVTSGDSPIPALNIKYNVTNRKVEALETLETSAGSFETVKISYDMTFKLGLAFSFSAVEWYADGVGMVRSEIYSNKGK